MPGFEKVESKMILMNNQEIIGTLQEIKKTNNFLCLDFIISKKIKIPENSINFDELKKLEGKRVGCINIDGKIRFRQIEK